MASSQKISQLNEVSSPSIEDVLPIVNSGETKKVTLDVIIQQASITMASYVNNLLLNYAPLVYVDSLAATVSTLANDYTDTQIDLLSGVISSQYASFTYVDGTFIPLVDRPVIINDAITEGYNNFIPLTDRQTIIDEASASALEASKEYTETNFITIFDRPVIIEEAFTQSKNYSHDFFIPLSSTETIIHTASSLAVSHGDSKFIPLSNTETIIYTASSLAAAYANLLLGGGTSGFINISDIPAIVHAASALSVAYGDSKFVPLSNIETIVDTASSLSVIYGDSKFVPLSVVSSIINTASALSNNYGDSKFIPLSNTETIVDTASSLAIGYLQNIKTTVETFSTAWLNPTKLFDYVLIGSVWTSFSGTALYGANTSDSVWVIKKIEYNNSGGVSSIKKAVNAVWDNRATSVIYI